MLKKIEEKQIGKNYSLSSLSTCIINAQQDDSRKEGDWVDFFRTLTLHRSSFLQDRKIKTARMPRQKHKLLKNSRQSEQRRSAAISTKQAPCAKKGAVCAHRTGYNSGVEKKILPSHLCTVNLGHITRIFASCNFCCTP